MPVACLNPNPKISQCGPRSELRTDCAGNPFSGLSSEETSKGIKLIGFH